MVRKMLVYLLPACPITRHKLPRLRAHGLLRRLLQILTVQYRQRESVWPARLPSVRAQFRRREHAPRAPLRLVLLECMPGAFGGSSLKGMTSVFVRPWLSSEHSRIPFLTNPGASSFRCIKIQLTDKLTHWASLSSGGWVGVAWRRKKSGRNRRSGFEYNVPRRRSEEVR